MALSEGQRRAQHCGKAVCWPSYGSQKKFIGHRTAQKVLLSTSSADYCCHQSQFQCLALLSLASNQCDSRYRCKDTMQGHLHGLHARVHACGLGTSTHNKCQLNELINCGPHLCILACCSCRAAGVAAVEDASLVVQVSCKGQWRADAAIGGLRCAWWCKGDLLVLIWHADAGCSTEHPLEPCPHPAARLVALAAAAVGRSTSLHVCMTDQTARD